VPANRLPAPKAAGTVIHRRPAQHNAKPDLT
jgi:hypothetical protein